MRQFLENTTGLSIYPLFSLVFFGLIFLGILVYVFTRSRKHIEVMSHLPLTEDHEIPAELERKPQSPSNPS